MFSEMQQQKANFGILSRPDGSALYTQGKTTLIAGVYGPIECKPTKMLIDKAQIEMHYRPKTGLPNVGDRYYEMVLRNVCETALLSVLYPRTSIVIVVQEMQNGGELMASAINASCLALLDSGIDMKFTVGAVSCCITENGELQIDPTSLQWDKAKATFVFVFDSVVGSIVASHTTGTFSTDYYTKALEACKVRSANVFEHFKEVMERKFAPFL